MVFFALLIPLLFLLVGVGLDLGWYYLNVSRLQNAADAAAVAGAREIIDSNSGKLKDLMPMLVEQLPEDN
ncbi:MAG: pilus assembly protein [Selenomonadaceae bacterium]|nr:pilus assembly protein [Selenomonadaceae bacterium]